MQVRSLLLSSLCAFAAVSSVEAAEVYVVHAIPGADLGVDPTLPVDISVDGACAFTNVVFGDVASATIPTGRIDVEVRLADGTCTGALAATGSFDLSINDTALIIAHLDENGVAKLSKFTVRTSAISDGDTRLTVIHAAAAPMVDVKLKNQDKPKKKATIRDLRSGDSTSALEVQEGTYKVKVSPAAGGPAVLNLDDLALSGNNVVVAAGSLDADTFTVILVPITG